MLRTRILLPLLCLALLAPALADTVTVGQVFYMAGSGSAGVPGFTIYNFTGPTFGCASGSGTPVCNEADFINSSLTVTFSDSTQVVASPSYGFAPGGYLYGDNPGDDIAQSFLFDTGALGHGDITDAVFSGTFSQDLFLLDDSSTFNAVSSFSVDLPLGLDGTAGSFDFVNIDATSVPVGNTVPEPASWWLMASGLMGLGWLGRRRLAATPGR